MGRVGDATVPYPGYPRDSVGRSDDAIAVAMARNSNNGGTTRSVVGPCHRNPSTCIGYVINGGGHRATTACGRGARAVDPASLLLAVALLRLVVVACLNAHKRHVRDPL